MHTTFLSWCASQGVTTPLRLLGASDDSSYRYLATESNLLSGSTIIRAPLGACLIDDSIENLAERVAHEKSLGTESKYAPYIDVLPTLDSPALQAMPRFWTSERLDTVTYGGCLRERMREDDRPLVDPWGMAIVNSRSNVLPGALFSVTPMLDMLNHDATVGTSARVTDEGELHINVDRSFAAGEEVFITYDDLTNLDTLCNYGFVALSNPCNAEVVEVRMIRKLPVPLVVEADGSISDAALAPLRGFLASTEEREKLDMDSMLAFARPVSDRNEEEVFALVGAALDDAVFEARTGAEAPGDDRLVANYLNGRAETLERGLDVIRKKYPDLGY